MLDADRLQCLGLEPAEVSGEIYSGAFIYSVDQDQDLASISYLIVHATLHVQCPRPVQHRGWGRIGPVLDADRLQCLGLEPAEVSGDLLWGFYLLR